MREWCWLKSLWSRLRGGWPVSGHDYIEQEVTAATVQVLVCRKCGAVSVGWTRGGGLTTGAP